MADWREGVARGKLALDRKRFLEERWRHSPEYLHIINRENVHSGLQADKFAKQQGTDPASQQIAVAREKAQFDAQVFEKRYTAQQKALISRTRTGQAQAHASGNYSDDELVAIDKAADLVVIGAHPSWLPRLSPNPEGEGLGDIWEKDGIWRGRRADGDTYQIDTAKTTGGVAQKAKLDLDAKDAAWQRKREQMMLEHRMKLQTTSIEDGLTKRMRTNEEVESSMRFAFGNQYKPKASEVANARKYLQEIYVKYGKDIPPEMQEAAQEAARILFSSKEKKKK